MKEIILLIMMVNGPQQNGVAVIEGFDSFKNCAKVEKQLNEKFLQAIGIELTTYNSLKKLIIKWKRCCKHCTSINKFCKESNITKEGPWLSSPLEGLMRAACFFWH